VRRPSRRRFDVGQTLASFGPFSALYFVFYEKFKGIAEDFSPCAPGEERSSSVYIAPSAAAGAVASLLTNPLDMAKLRLQVQRGAPDKGMSFFYRHTGHAVVSMLREEGPRALLRGAGARVLFHAPSTAISLTLYEHFKNMYTKVLS